MTAGLLRRAPLWRFGGIYMRGGKRMFDLCCVIFTSPLWVPLVGVLWLIAWLEAGQGFYVDRRIGRHGRSFKCLKNRTMMPSAARGCAAFKRRYDPRVTSIGRLMRRASLDELPQLICVLKGEMSLVGPRPVPATELTRYGAAQDQYQSVRPGLSGLWQVSGRNALPYPDRIALDVRYSRNVSFVLDLKILCATLREIWRMSGR